MIKAVIFDCWGTLFYNKSGYLSSIAAELGTTIEDYAFLKRFEGLLMVSDSQDLVGLVEALMQEMGFAPDPDKAQAIVTLMLESRDCQEAFPESIEVLKSLKGRFKLALLSNTSQPSFERLLHDHGLDDLFDCLLPSCETGLLKPDPEVFKLACERLGVEAAEVCMVGDSLKDDFEAATHCGMKAILVDRTGRHADVMSSVDDLTKLLGLL